MRTVRGIECYEQSDLCENTNIAWAVRDASKLWEDRMSEYSDDGGRGVGFEIDFISKGEKKPIKHKLLQFNPTNNESYEALVMKEKTIEECIEVFENYGIKIECSYEWYWI